MIRLRKQLDLPPTEELREFCHNKVVAVLEQTNSLDTFFEVVYHHNDLKKDVLDFVTGVMKRLLLDDRGLFAAYEDHPEGYILVVEISKHMNLASGSSSMRGPCIYHLLI
ncbi:hypothetical protein BG003_006776 [Podila horticola]|nr:hypothetical protein BG003_006776 [Podila horticola]